MLSPSLLQNSKFEPSNFKQHLNSHLKIEMFIVLSATKLSIFRRNIEIKGTKIEADN
jgi:hypothetical protein